MPAPSFTSSFFLIVPPGLEDLALEELKSHLPEAKKLKKVVGGIEFESDISQGVQLNFSLKIPSRILLRLDEFGARDFPKFFKKLQKISWEDLISADSKIKVEASSEASRLFLKKRIVSTTEDAIKKYFKILASSKLTPSKSVSLEIQKIFIRISENLCTVSIDTSGEHLHKRGYRKLIGEAPLRENLAAALLKAILKHSPQYQEIEIVDPMAGSGTFLLEAYHDFLRTDLRAFAFQNWPIFSEFLAQHKTLFDPRIKSLRGFDQDLASAQITNENLKVLRGGARELADTPKFAFQKKNILTEGEFPASELIRIVVCNPPYGKRLKVKGKISEFYAELFSEVANKLKPQLAGFLITEEAGPIKMPAGYKPIEQIRFRNGGIRVRFIILKAQDSN